VPPHLVAVIDDDASVRRSLMRLLQSADLRVLTHPGDYTLDARWASSMRRPGVPKRDRVPDRRAARQSKSYDYVRDHTMRIGGLGHGRTGTRQ